MFRLKGRLPHRLYDNLPAFYLLAAVAAILLAPNLFGLIAFCALYTSGAVIWCLRSAHRRSDAPARFLFFQQRWILPKPLYESLPFILIGIALLLVSGLIATPPLKLLALPLMVYGALRLLQRIHHRRHVQLQEH
jgi:hypothetical protein